MVGSCGSGMSGGGSGLAQKCGGEGGKIGRGRRENWKGKMKRSRKGIRWFLNPLMFDGCHVIKDHKRPTPHVPCLLMFVGLATSLTNISGQCHVRYQPVICSSVTCQTNERKISLSVLKTDKYNLNYVCHLMNERRFPVVINAMNTSDMK
jgi:hypothetical protein